MRPAIDVEPCRDLEGLARAIDLDRRATSPSGDSVRAGLADPPSARADGMGRDPARRSRSASTASMAFIREQSGLAGHGACCGGAPRRRLLVERKPPAVVRAYFAHAAADHGDRQARPCPRLQGRRPRPRRRRARSATPGARTASATSFEGRILEAFPGVLDPGRSPLPHGALPLQGELGRGAAAAGHAGKDYATLVKARIGRRPQGRRRPTRPSTRCRPTLREDTSYLFSRAHLSPPQQQAGRGRAS